MSKDDPAAERRRRALSFNRRRTVVHSPLDKEVTL